jgi:hypothetical protein
MLNRDLMSGEEGSLGGVGAEGGEASDVSCGEEAQEFHEGEQGGILNHREDLGQGAMEDPSVREGDGGRLDGAEDGLCGEGDSFRRKGF